MDDDFNGLRVVRRGLAIYVLLCPITRKVRYVGSTKKPWERKQQHTKYIASRPNAPVQVWTNEMIRNGTPAIFKVLCMLRGAGWGITKSDGTGRTMFLPEKRLLAIERQLIRDCIREGCDLLNVASVPRIGSKA